MACPSSIFTRAAEKIRADGDGRKARRETWKARIRKTFMDRRRRRHQTVIYLGDGLRKADGNGLRPTHPVAPLSHAAALLPNPGSLRRPHPPASPRGSLACILAGPLGAGGGT